MRLRRVRYDCSRLGLLDKDGRISSTQCFNGYWTEAQFKEDKDSIINGCDVCNSTK